jgi:hypothetical protein
MKKAVLTLCVGELYWELARFVPYIIWRKEREYFDLIAITRKERYDLYGKHAKKFISIEIEGDEITKKSECFKLNGFSNEEYTKLIIDEKEKLTGYDEIEMVCPKLNKFSSTVQFDKLKFSYNFQPREINRTFIESLNISKQIVIIAPRFRQNVPRNWINWKQFYDLLYKSDLRNEFEFIICGRRPDYISDERFLDINNFKHDGTLIGLTIELIKKAKLVVGSQSAIPSLSLLLETPVLQWGHNRKILMTSEYNPKKTRCTFLDDSQYMRSAEDIYNEMTKILL